MKWRTFFSLSSFPLSLLLSFSSHPKGKADENDDARDFYVLSFPVSLTHSLVVFVFKYEYVLMSE